MLSSYNSHALEGVPENSEDANGAGHAMRTWRTGPTERRTMLRSDPGSAHYLIGIARRRPA
jgi:hypothetical protein